MKREIMQTFDGSTGRFRLVRTRDLSPSLRGKRVAPYRIERRDPGKQNYVIHREYTDLGDARKGWLHLLETQAGMLDITDPLVTLAGC